MDKDNDKSSLDRLLNKIDLLASELNPTKKEILRGECGELAREVDADAVLREAKKNND